MKLLRAEEDDLLRKLLSICIHLSLEMVVMSLSFVYLGFAEALPTLLKPDTAPTVSCGERQNMKAFDVANKLTLLFFR